MIVLLEDGTVGEVLCGDYTIGHSVTIILKNENGILIRVEGIVKEILS